MQVKVASVAEPELVRTRTGSVSSCRVQLTVNTWRETEENQSDVLSWTLYEPLSLGSPEQTWVQCWSETGLFRVGCSREASRCSCFRAGPSPACPGAARFDSAWPKVLVKNVSRSPEIPNCTWVKHVVTSSTGVCVGMKSNPTSWVSVTDWLSTIFSHFLLQNAVCAECCVQTVSVGRSLPTSCSLFSLRWTLMSHQDTERGSDERRNL